jgi:H+-transporting ATPase
VIVAFAIFRGDRILTTLQFALVLTVAAIPVAMPTVLSVTMAVGARLLAKKQAIVSRLVAIEELAGVDVLCADKTGTLTQNKLTLGDPFCVNAVPAAQVILAAALASRADNNDTIDLAVLGGLKDGDKTLQGYHVDHFQPFDPVHKRTEATVKTKDGKTFKATKGAPQVILDLSANADAVKPTVVKAIAEFAGRGFRSLGVARADDDGKWQFLGVWRTRRSPFQSKGARGTGISASSACPAFDPVPMAAAQSKVLACTLRAYGSRRTLVGSKRLPGPRGPSTE